MNEIFTTKDPWLRKKNNFCVEHSHVYEGRNKKVESLFSPNSKQWNVNQIHERFLKEDAEAILTVLIPQRNIHDRVAWTISSNGLCNTKDDYHFRHKRNVGTTNVPQNRGLGKIRRLSIPHKMKIFIWRFCRNNVHVRKRLSFKGVVLPITCHMCNNDIEHLLHVFFDSTFDFQCWNHMSLSYDTRKVDYARGWLLNKLEEGFCCMFNEILF